MPSVLLAILAAAPANVPALPADVPARATQYTVLTMGAEVGQLALWDVDGVRHAFYQFNDRGRGPKTHSTLALKDGLPVDEQVEGNDYLKNPVSESFRVQEGRARWKSNAESGERASSGGAFFLSMYGPPSDLAALARALIEHGGSLPLLPEGEARIQRVKPERVTLEGTAHEVTLYAVVGLDFAPTYLWLDEHLELFAQTSPWSSLIRRGAESAFEALLQSQQRSESERAKELAHRIGRRPKGKLLIRDAAVFDAEAARLVPHRDVLISGNRILSVAPTGPRPSGGLEVIEAKGKSLIPGLWDMHAHVQPNEGMLNLAAGVTTVRDLANDMDDLLARRERIERGEELGTRIVIAGFIDGPGPYQGPTKVLVADEKAGREWVDKYAALGCVQIKLYSSLKPELVAPLAEEAHSKGLRVSGHVPSGMLATDAVMQGYDELQHVNFLLLNFMPDVRETRTPARFLEPARRAADLDLSSPAVREFIHLLQDRHTALDPTLSVFEAMMLDRPGMMAVGLTPVAERLPAQVRRNFRSGGLPVPPGMDERYRASWTKTLQLVRALYEAGIPIEAGTDSLAGFALHRELELDAQAGIPAPQVLKLATLGAAQVMGLDKDLGQIRPGKLADMVLLDADPTQDISAVRKTFLTIKDGLLYSPAELYSALGVKP